jgi:hypothetical protein
MAVDLSGFGYLLPLWTFLLVFIIVFAVLVTTKLVGDNKFWLLFVSFVVSSVFITAAGARAFVETAVPWGVVFLVSAFFILLLTGFIGEPVKALKGGITIGLVVLLLLVFLFSALYIFSDSFLPYLPGGTAGGTTQLGAFLDWLYSPPVGGMFLLLLVSALVGWILVKAK